MRIKEKKCTEASILQSRIQSPELQYLENTRPTAPQYLVSPETNDNTRKNRGTLPTQFYCTNSKEAWSSHYSPTKKLLQKTASIHFFSFLLATRLSARPYLAKLAHTVFLFLDLALEGFSGVSILLEASLEFHLRNVPRLWRSEYAFWVLPSHNKQQHFNNFLKQAI